MRRFIPWDNHNSAKMKANLQFHTTVQIKVCEKGSNHFKYNSAIEESIWRSNEMCTVGFSLNPRRSHSNTFKADFINNSYKKLILVMLKKISQTWSIFMKFYFLNIHIYEPQKYFKDLNASHKHTRIFYIFSLFFQVWI